MGVTKGADALYHLQGLTTADVAACIRGLYADRKLAGDELKMDLPTIDGDSNNILKVVGGKSTTKSAAVAAYFLNWKDTGIKVHPVVDGNTRPNAKKATCDRRANRQRDYINSYVLLKEVNKLKRDLAAGSFSAEEMTERNKVIKKKEEQCSKKLTRSQQSWPVDFAQALEEELVNGAGLRSRDSSGGFIGAVLEATYEADYAIIGRFVNNEIVAALTSDSDIAIQAGDGLPCIKKFTEGKDGMTIVCTCKATLVAMMNHLPVESKMRVEIKDAACPIFEGVRSRKLRALMMVACGCDVYPTGISGVAPKSLKKGYLDKLKLKMPECDRTDEHKIYNALFDMVVMKAKLDASVIDTFVKALIYQPTNYKSCEVMSTAIVSEEREQQYTYMDNQSPDVLPSYLFDDFAQPGVTTLDAGGPDVMTCIGAEDRSHKFLSQIGFKNCHGCNGIVCGKCMEAINGMSFCLVCAAGELLVPRRDDHDTERINFMRHELKHQYQWDGADTLPVDQVEEAYNAAIKPYTNQMELMNEVAFPLHPTSELKDPTKWRKISTIYFNNGGTFISDPSLHNHVPALLHLFSMFVKYEDAKTCRRTWMKEEGVYDALPSMIINFAEKSRVNSGEATGFRLLERCVRHGHDPRMASLFYSNADIIVLEDGTIGLVIGSKVPASMRGLIYNTTTAHTATDLLAAECNCKSGSKGEEKVVCVHNNVIPYGVTKLMYEGLAEHILIELSSCVASLFEKWTVETKSSVKESIILLMQAAGVSIHDYDKQSMTIDELLERFVTGTEKEKAWGQGVSKFVCLPKPGPIREMCFDSPAKKAKHLKNKNKMENAVEVDGDSDERIDSFTKELNEQDKDGDGVPNYFQASSLIKAAGIDLSSFDPVGCRLLKLRADKADVSHDDIMDSYRQMCINWKEIKSESEVRTRRRSESQSNNLAQKRPCNDLIRPIVLDHSFAMHDPPSKKRRIQPTRGKAKASPQQPKKVGRPKIHDVKPKPNRKSKKPHTYCSKEGCSVNNISHPNTRFHRIPAIPPELPLDAPKQKHIARTGKLLNREEIMDRSGFKRNLNSGGVYRICEEHDYEYVTKSKAFLYARYVESKLKPSDEDWVVIKKKTQSYKLHVPKAEGACSTNNLTTKKTSTGIATDRMKRRQLEEVNAQIKKGRQVHADVPSESDSLRADAARSRLAVQLMAENNSPSMGKRSESKTSLINQSVAREAGLPVESRSCTPIAALHGKKLFFHPETVTPKSSNSPGEKKNFVASADPVVTLGMGYDDVQRRTGFRSEEMLLVFIFLVCEGDVDIIRRRCTSLTWYEEWFFFAEMIYGRSLTTWWHAMKAYGPQEKYMRAVFRQKLVLVKRSRQRWGYFVTYAEDLELRKDKWNIKYRDRDGAKTRVIMWDMTGIEAYRFGAADLQRNTYSKYYAGNYFKGGIGIQLCSWGVTWALWGGHESDSGYHESAGYLEAQEEFQKKDIVHNTTTNSLEVVPFTNVLDKGYRARAANWRHGEQLTAQPIFGKSDQQFKGEETKYSASLASDRGANERGVNVSKRSGIIKRGFKPGMDAALFDDAWLSWGYMANFMYKQVL